VSVQATFCATLVDEWARFGVSDAVICPGSRSTPLAVPLAQRFRTHIKLDERSAGFFALGLAMQTARPTVVCVTSGTAAVELHPAVVEAYHAGIPLLVCTADRPPELHETGAPQTVEQVGLYGGSIRWSFSPGVPVTGQESSWRPLAARAFAEATQGPFGPGPVHLNFAFREPLTGQADPLPTSPGPRVFAGTAARHGTGGPSGGAAGAPVRTPVQAEPLGGRGIIVVGGQQPEPPDAASVRRLADHLRWPVVADPLSRCRLPGTIAAADAIVRVEPALPDTVVILGRPWLSKALGAYLRAGAASGARVVVVDPWWRWADPDRIATEVHRVDPTTWLDTALTDGVPCKEEWLATWLDMEQRAQSAIDEVLAGDLSEPSLARSSYVQAAGQGATVVAAASMPIRDLEWFAPTVTTPPPVFANRGANGIDGVVSTALGVASAVPEGGGGTPTVALLGDLAFLHDVSGLVNLPECPCTFVVPDNHGGGIFSFLPQAREFEHSVFERIFATPPTSDISEVARGFGLRVDTVGTTAELEAALCQAAVSNRGPALIRAVVPGRSENVALHDSVNQAVRRALQ
jgi:2-succinyl-5-enolpyruvyl-6-hydroxy-3-cyclohexene-1-carboxylate synthase